jgi:hypothetical protein
LLRWCAAILTAVDWKSNNSSSNSLDSIVELLGQLELPDPRPRLSGEVVRHLEKDEVRVDELFAGPALLDERG